MLSARLEALYRAIRLALGRAAGERPAAVLAVLALLLFLPGLVATPPIDRDEARFAQASRQMLESGDFLDIRFQDEARHKKPVGIYWLQAASAGLLGGGADAGIWAYRLPSVAGGLAAVLLTFWAGRRLFGREAAFAGAVMLAACLNLVVEARLAKTDAVLLACVVLAQAALARLYLGARDKEPPGFWVAMAFWAAQGLGILVKGPIVVMVSGLTVLTLCILERRTGWLRVLRPLPGLLLAALLAAPWMVAIQLATEGAFFREAIGRDLLGKIAQAQESHGAPPGTYLVTIWVSLWPFSLIAGLAVPWIWRQRKDPAVRFCLAWAIPTWLILELAVTKLPHYILPLMPAITLLAGQALTQWQGEGLRHWARFLPLAIFGAVSLALAAALPAASWYLQGTPNPWGLVGAAGALAVFGLGLLHVLRGQPRNPLGPMAAAALLAYMPAFHGVLPTLDTLWMSPRIAETVAEHRICEEPAASTDDKGRASRGSWLGVSGFTEPSLVFLVGTDVKIGRGGEIARHLLDNPDCALALIGGEKAAADFDAALTAAGRAPELLASIPGLNYVRGDVLDVKLYRLRN